MFIQRLPAIGLFLLIFTSILIAVYAVGFQARLIGAPSFHERFDQVPIAGTMHVIGGAIVLFIGGFQFWGRLRQNQPNLHRWLGRVYLSLVALGGIAALMLSRIGNG